VAPAKLPPPRFQVGDIVQNIVEDDWLPDKIVALEYNGHYGYWEYSCEDIEGIKTTIDYDDKDYILVARASKTINLVTIRRSPSGV
jgi:hypothetical protein